MMYNLPEKCSIASKFPFWRGLTMIASLMLYSCSSSDSGSSGAAATPTPTASPTVEPIIYVGGQFSSIGGVAANGFGKLSDGKWSTVSEYQSADSTTRVYSLAKDQNSKIIVGGIINSSSGLASTSIGRWNNGWESVGALTAQIIATTAVDSKGVLYAGGVDSISATINNVHKFDGTTWTDLGGCPNYIQTILLDTQDIPHIGCGDNNVKTGQGYVKKWNGSAWTALGSGMTGGVTSLAFDSSGVLYAGGAFTTANGVAANGIAKWNGSTWEALGTGQTGTVYSLAFNSKGVLYAAGDSLQGGNIVSWNGTEWTGLSATPNKGVLKIKFDSSDRLYAGGNFTTAGSIVANGFARWDGTTWSALGNDSNANSIVRAILIE